MIAIQNLTMKYGSFTALERVSFEVGQGEILGLLGPNGAGKTTLMRILTTYLYPTAGTAQIARLDILQDPIGVRRKMGYLPENVPLYPEMQVDEYLAFIAQARSVEPALIPERFQWVQKECGLKPVWKHKLSELSKGYRQRTGLAQALIHDPEVLILDEPTSGLDPLQIIGIRELIRSLAKQKTIIFSTHILQEVEALADRIVIINDGKIVANGTEEQLTQKALKVQRVRFAVKEDKERVEQALRELGVCDEIHFIGSTGSGFQRFMIRSQSGKPLIAMIDELVKNRKWPLREMAEETASLEEAFINLLKPGKTAEQTHGQI